MTVRETMGTFLNSLRGWDRYIERMTHADSTCYTWNGTTLDVTVRWTDRTGKPGHHVKSFRAAALFPHAAVNRTRELARPVCWYRDELIREVLRARGI